MNPRLARLQPYPFEKLRALLAGIEPNPELSPINLSIGEPKHPTPALVRDALVAALDGLAVYQATAGLPALREAIADRRARETPQQTAARLRAEFGVELSERARQPLARAVYDDMSGDM